MSELDGINRETLHDLNIKSFDGYPFMISRVLPTLFHIILLPAELPEKILKEIAHFQAILNSLDTCLVLGAQECIYFNVDGSSTASDFPPRGNYFVSGKLLPCIDFPVTEELRKRTERLKAFIDSLPAKGYVLGDITKGGRQATEEEIQRLSGTQTNGVPKGLIQCKTCGDWAGECLDPNFKGMVMKVHCRCENDNFCARCGKPLYKYKLNANYFGQDGKVWHVPGFSAFTHRCLIDHMKKCFSTKRGEKMKIKINGDTIWILENNSFPAKGVVICNGKPEIECIELEKSTTGYKICNPILFLWTGEMEKVEDSD